MALMDQRLPDLAVLDWRLETETASPSAYRLTAFAVPFLFHTSSRSRPNVGPPRVPLIQKPTKPEQLVAALKALTRQLY